LGKERNVSVVASTFCWDSRETGGILGGGIADLSHALPSAFLLDGSLSRSASSTLLLSRDPRVVIDERHVNLVFGEQSRHMVAKFAHCIGAAAVEFEFDSNH
jgi:hypothetical protein